VPTQPITSRPFQPSNKSRSVTPISSPSLHMLMYSSPTTDGGAHRQDAPISSATAPYKQHHRSCNTPMHSSTTVPISINDNVSVVQPLTSVQHTRSSAIRPLWQAPGPGQARRVLPGQVKARHESHDVHLQQSSIDGLHHIPTTSEI
jgi:hypothetical protein